MLGLCLTAKVLDLIQHQGHNMVFWKTQVPSTNSRERYGGQFSLLCLVQAVFKDPT